MVEQMNRGKAVSNVPGGQSGDSNGNKWYQTKD